MGSSFTSVNSEWSVTVVYYTWESFALWLCPLLTGYVSNLRWNAGWAPTQLCSIERAFLNQWPASGIISSTRDEIKCAGQLSSLSVVVLGLCVYSYSFCCVLSVVSGWDNYILGAYMGVINWPKLCSDWE
jgi:hypothetical protein